MISLRPRSPPGLTSHGLSSGRTAPIHRCQHLRLFVIGVQRIGRSLPFGLALGATRRSFYAGTALLGVALALVSTAWCWPRCRPSSGPPAAGACPCTFFRVPYILDGPWYPTWLTSFVGLAALFVCGMWFGIVYRRWSLLGLLAFIAAQVLVVLAVGCCSRSATAALLRSVGHSSQPERPRADRGDRGAGGAAARGRAGHHPPRHRLRGPAVDPRPADARLPSLAR